MPRIGMNPAREQKTEYKPSSVTLAMLTYLPDQTGYFEHRFDVTRLSLESLIAHTSPPYDLIVFDNGSCEVLVDYLRSMCNAGKITNLILSSRNIGKIGALKVIFQSAMGEIVAYTDDDVFFLPGWLEAHLKILETFPRVGMVTGFYLRTHMVYGIQSTLAFANQLGVKKSSGLLIDEKWERHYIDNMGRTWNTYRQETQGLEDVLLSYNGSEALVSAGHHQFVAPRHVLLEALPQEWNGQLMGKMIELDEAVDNLGYLRLSTLEPVTRLLGNAIGSEMAAEARAFGLPATGVEVRQPKGLLARFYRLPVVKSLARAAYNRLYRIIHV